jgi:hypothetical protein
MLDKHWIRMHTDDTEKRYMFPRPDTDRFERAIRKARHTPSELTRDEGHQLAEVAAAYRHLLAHPAGTESVLKKLRELRMELKIGNVGDDKGEVRCS